MQLLWASFHCRQPPSPKLWQPAAQTPETQPRPTQQSPMRETSSIAGRSRLDRYRAYCLHAKNPCADRRCESPVLCTAADGAPARRRVKTRDHLCDWVRRFASVRKNREGTVLSTPRLVQRAPMRMALNVQIGHQSQQKQQKCTSRPLKT